MLVSLGGCKAPEDALKREGLDIKHPQRVQETSCSGGGCVPPQWGLRSLHAGSEMAAPSRAPVGAQMHFSMQRLVPASRLGEQSLGPGLYLGNTDPDSKSLPSITRLARRVPSRQQQDSAVTIAIVPFAHQLVQSQRSKDDEDNDPGVFLTFLSSCAPSPASSRRRVSGSRLSRQRWGV